MVGILGYSLKKFSKKDLDGGVHYEGTLAYKGDNIAVFHSEPGHMCYRRLVDDDVWNRFSSDISKWYSAHHILFDESPFDSIIFDIDYLIDARREALAKNMPFLAPVVFKDGVLRVFFLRSPIKQVSQLETSDVVSFLGCYSVNGNILVR